MCLDNVFSHLVGENSWLLWPSYFYGLETSKKMNELYVALFEAWLLSTLLPVGIDSKTPDFEVWSLTGRA